MTPGRWENAVNVRFFYVIQSFAEKFALNERRSALNDGNDTIL